MRSLNNKSPIQLLSNLWQFSGKWISISILFFLVSALTTNTFLIKWGLNEKVPDYSFVAMIEGNASRPFVYRRMIPEMVKGIEYIAPPLLVSKVFDLFEIKDRAGDFMLGNCRWEKYENIHCMGKGWEDSKFRFRYLVTYGLMFAFAFFSLWVMRSVCMAISPGSNLHEIFPVIFFICLPVTFVRGGYFYDFSELFFLFTLVLAALRERWLLFCVICPIAVINKETIVIVPLLMAPLLVTRLSKYRALVVVVVATALAALVSEYIKHQFKLNAGGERLFHWWENFDFWISKEPWFSFYLPVSAFIPFPSPANLLSLMAISYIWMRFARYAPTEFRLFLALSMCVSGLLSLVWGYRDEVRNLSLAFPAIFICVYAGWNSRPAPNSQTPLLGGR